MILRKPLVGWRYALSARYRHRRFQFFWNKAGCTSEKGWWLDLGSGPGSYFLSHMAGREKIILLDVSDPELRAAQARHPQGHCFVADGQHLPFKNDALTCTFCNSVIEHVPDPSGLASEIRRTGRRFFVQTPNGGFPFETHSAIPLPFFRLMPVRLRRLVCKLVGASYEYVSGVTYISREDLARFFPTAAIETERAFSLVKSFYVVGGPR
jgi:SAM-dependent methyltransferase